MKNGIQKKLGKRIRELRQQRGLSQEKLAEYINIATNTLSNIERGQAFMSAALFDRLIAILNITPKELFTFEDDIECDNYSYILQKLEIIKNDNKKLSKLKKIIDIVFNV